MARTILIVDDEEATAFGLQSLLEGPDSKVLTAGTFEDALALIGDWAFDVALLDVRLGSTGDEAGLAILRHLKAHSPGTRVILMTGFGKPSVMEESFRLGVDYYFEKPIRLETLMSVVLTVDQPSGRREGTP